jgi:hypothetical protein
MRKVVIYVLGTGWILFGVEMATADVGEEYVGGVWSWTTPVYLAVTLGVTYLAGWLAGRER